MKKIYFASDLHLGAPYIPDNREHEARIVAWLDSIRPDAEALYLLGDVFDYWFEYRTVVPRGHVRFLAKIAQLVDEGIAVHIFTGNHDVWMFDYLQSELGATVHTRAEMLTIAGRKFWVGHGDELGFDKPYAFMLGMFRNPILQWLYKWCIHPDVSGLFATTWSHKSRLGHYADEKRKPDPETDDELQVRFARQQVAKGLGADFFIFGHRHRVMDVSVGDNGERLIVLGDWVRNPSFVSFDGNELTLRHYK